MTTSEKLLAGAEVPSIVVPGLDGSPRDITRPRGDADWMMVVVYRGRHCPKCTRYLNALEPFREQLAGIGVDVAAASADSEAQVREHLSRLEIEVPLYHSLSIAQMQSLGLYISHPRSPKETDHPFAEPGLLVINAERTLQVVDISNNPFVRPELKTLVSGLAWIRDPSNRYPIRGTFTAAS